MKKRSNAGSLVLTFLPLLFYVVFFIGWIKCIIKAVNCNWEPIGKAEIIYTVGVFTGAGGIIGWIDIKDK